MFCSGLLLVLTLTNCPLSRGIEMWVWEGERAVLPCPATKESTDVFWCKVNADMCNPVVKKYAHDTKGKKDTEYEVLPNGSLLISSVSYERHMGTYRCRSNVNNWVQIHVMQPVKSVTLSTPSSVVSANTQIAVTCEVNGGNPAPNISWYLGESEKAVKKDVGRTGPDTTYKYEVLPTKEMNGQRIVCEASVKEKSLSDETTINVTYKPAVTAQTHPVQYYFGDEVILECRVEGNPRPDITWMFGEESVHSDDRKRNTSGHTHNGVVTINYRINDLTRKLIGSYTCFARNAEGNDSVDIIVKSAGTRESENQLTIVTDIVLWCVLGVGLAVTLAVFVHVYRSYAQKPSFQTASTGEVTQDQPPSQPVNPDLQGHYASIQFIARPPQQVTPQEPGTSRQQDDRTIYASVDFKATARLAKRNKKITN